MTTQPYQHEGGRHVLCWNGEAWHIDNEPSIEDDTASIYTLLCKALANILESASEHSGHMRAKAIARALSRVAGPYAFVFLDREQGHLYFGRDFLGRRSLCWRQSSDGNLILCSITDGSSPHDWQEVEADGVYFADIHGLGNVPLVGSNSEYPAHSPTLTCVPYSFIGESSSVRHCLYLYELNSSCRGR